MSTASLCRLLLCLLLVVTVCSANAVPANMKDKSQLIRKLWQVCGHSCDVLLHLGEDSCRQVCSFVQHLKDHEHMSELLQLWATVKHREDVLEWAIKDTLQHRWKTKSDDDHEMVLYFFAELTKWLKSVAHDEL